MYDLMGTGDPPPADSLLQKHKFSNKGEGEINFYQEVWEGFLEKGGFGLGFEKGVELQQVDIKGNKFGIHSWVPACYRFQVSMLLLPRELLLRKDSRLDVCVHVC